MNPRRFALIGGIVMLVMGVLALVPGFSTYSLDLPVLRVESSYGLFLGLFPMNIFNKLALIAFGIWGISASRRPATSLPASILFSRWTFGVMGVLAVLGMFPATNTLNGYWPLFGYEILAHGAFSLVGAYFGFALPAKAHAEGRTPARRVEGTLREI